jgi:RpiB/LacA/LacB family sugar-phosphate isomerase
MKKYNLLLPIAGKAQRFIDAGYTMPKALILAKNKHVIDWAMDSVDIKNCNLIFLVRVDHVYNFSIDKILKQKFGDDITIIKLSKVTRGALETCTLAREHIDNDLPLIIYTPDVHFGPVFNPDNISNDSDGFLLTFTANSPDHSYSEYGEDGIVTNVVEKEVISKEANVGLYHFKTGKIFLKYADEMIQNEILVKNEFYIAPMYNLMIRDGLKVTAANTEKMHVLGTPHQFEFFCKRVITRFGDKPIALASDHSGYDCKKQTKDIMDKLGLPYIDVGTYTDKACDYPDYVLQVTKLIENNDCSHGISFCRSGQGANITANKVDGIISALCFDDYTAEYAIKHNCANHFAIPSKYMDKAKIQSMIETMLKNTFDGGRHFTRLHKLL